MVFNREMAVRGGAVDMAAFVFLAVLGNNSRKISAATQDFRQHGFAADMHHNKNRSIEILRQIFGEVTKRLYAARRRSDDDDVAFVHLVKPPSKVNRSYTVQRVDRLFRNGLPCASGRQGFGNNLLAVAEVHRLLRRRWEESAKMLESARPRAAN